MKVSHCRLLFPILSTHRTRIIVRSSFVTCDGLCSSWGRCVMHLGGQWLWINKYPHLYLAIMLQLSMRQWSPIRGPSLWLMSKKLISNLHTGNVGTHYSTCSCTAQPLCQWVHWPENQYQSMPVISSIQLPSLGHQCGWHYILVTPGKFVAAPALNSCRKINCVLGLVDLHYIDCLEHKGDMSSFWSFGLFGAKSLILAKPNFCLLYTSPSPRD